MKVRDIITEAPTGTNKFSRFLSKTFGTGRGDSVAADAMDQWADYAKTLERGGTDLTAANYNQYLNQWLGKWIGMGRPFPGKLTNFTGRGVNDYIARAVAQAKTGTIPHVDGPEANSKPKQDLGPETDVSKIVEPGMQFRFPHPDYSGVNIIVRPGKWYIDRLPKHLRGQVPRDPDTKMFPVQQPANIKKYNQYYNDAADLGTVKEEPAVAL